MKIIIRHPQVHSVPVEISIDDASLPITTIAQLLKIIELELIDKEKDSEKLDYSKIWNLRNCKTGEILDKSKSCDCIDPDNNEFTIVMHL